MGFYSTLGMGDISDYWNFVLIHWQVSMKDALMVVLIYLGIGMILRNWFWAKPRIARSPDQPHAADLGLRSSNIGWAILIIALPVWQAIIEYYSVYIYGRWGYAESMQLILGIGLLPILQMLILPSLSVLLSRHLLGGRTSDTL